MPFEISAKMASQASQSKTLVPMGLFINQHPFVRQVLVDRIYGCIIGSALGDAIGLYTEFLPKKVCAQLYPGRKFSLVEPTTELRPDTHRGKSSHLHFGGLIPRYVIILSAKIPCSSERSALIFPSQLRTSRMD